MKIADLAAILGITEEEARQQLVGEEVLNISLTERRQKGVAEKGVIEVL